MRYPTLLNAALLFVASAVCAIPDVYLQILKLMHCRIVQRIWP